MRYQRICLPLLLAFTFPFDPANSAQADGKFFRRLEATDEPGIRSQRAVIAFRDSVETLIVQSDVQGSDASYGWLLPLPGEPTSIEACPPNTLHTLGKLVQPRIADTPKAFLQISLLTLAIVIAVCLDHLRRTKLGSGRAWLTKIALTLVSLVVLAEALLPSLTLSHRGQIHAGVDVLQTTQAGVYNVAVIKGQSAEGVETWLKANGFTCPSSARRVIGEYVADEWVFLAAKVSHNAAGSVTHHPLKVTFPVNEAVYPMRLTGCDGQPVQLDLFVIADERAEAARMKTWVSDSYEPSARNRGCGDFESESTLIFAGNTISRAPIGIPTITALMWPKCTLTWLHGRMSPTDMSRDLTIDWRSTSPERHTLHSRSSAAGWGIGVAAFVFALMLCLSTIEAVRNDWTARIMLRKRLLTVTALALFAGGVCYVALDVVPVTHMTRRDMRVIMARAEAHASVLRELSEDPPNTPFPQAYRAKLKELHYRTTIEETEYPEEPGDFKIESIPDGFRLTFIDWQYVPITVRISPEGKPSKLPTAGAG